MKNNIMKVSRQAHIEIVVQPLPTAVVNQWLVSPIVARTRDPQLLYDYSSGSRHLFATAMLYSSNMDDHTSALGGNWNVSAQFAMETSTSSSRSGGGGEEWLYFIFNPMSVGVEGTFAFDILVSALSLSSPDQAGMSEVVGGRATRQFSVVSQPSRGEKIGQSCLPLT